MFIKRLVRLVLTLSVGLCRLFIPKKSVILVGSYFGYVGEAKAYYDFLNDRGEVFFVFRNAPKIFDSRFVRMYSVRWLWLVLRSKMFIVSHICSDVFPIKPAGVLLVNVWHGEPLKRIGFDSKVEKLWLDKKGNSEYLLWDFLVVSNERYKQKMLSATRLPNEKIVVAGSLLHSSIVKKRLSVKTNFSNRGLRVLFLPTFRNSPFFKSSMELISFKEDLNALGVSIDIKPHPNELRNIDFGNILPTQMDPYELIEGYDLVLTDYSSILFDCMSLGIPFALWVPDIVDYEASIGGFYDDIQKLESARFVAYSSKCLVRNLSVFEKCKATSLNSSVTYDLGFLENYL